MGHPLSSTAGPAGKGFSLRRLGLVAGLDLRENLTRPLFLIFAALLAWNGWLMARGAWFYQSIDTSLGGIRSWVDSEFQIAWIFAQLSLFLIAFAVAIAAGTPLARDEELKVGPLLHSTPLRPSEYVWGKFLAVLASTLLAVAVLPVSLWLFKHLSPDTAYPLIYGPGRFASYLGPTLVFLLPSLVFIAGAAFALGRFTGRPIVAFLLPVILLLFFKNFLWRYYPPTMGPGLSALLRHLDPSGFRWLKQTWLFFDRGIGFYNTHPIVYDAPFLLSRAGFVLAGLLLVDLSRRHFSGRLRRTPRKAPREQTESAPAAAVPAPLAALGMTSRPPGVLRGIAAVARFELAELRSQPGLYVFVPAILLFLYVFYAGSYDNLFAPLILTPGTAAVKGLIALTTWLCLLFLFYTVESLERERATGMAPVFYATPVPTASVVLGKALALGAVAALAIAAGVLMALWTILRQGAIAPAELDPRPFLLVWGLFLPPTLVAWVAFVGFVLVATRSRNATYGIGLAVPVATVLLLARNHLSWAGNWPLVGGGPGNSALVWSDLGTFDLDGRAVVLNRLLVLAAAAPLAWAAVRFFPRRERDRLRPVLAPSQRRRAALTAAGLCAVPLALGLFLQREVERGYQGGAVVERHREYWRKNHATWLNQPQPYVTNVDLDLDFEPARRSFRAAGFYDLQNRRDEPLDWFAISGGSAWRDLAWTLDGRPWHPEDRAGLHVFRLPRPLGPGGSLRLGFRYRATLLAGISKNGGFLAADEFVLPSGVILTGRNPDFVPVVGYVERIGVDEKNRYEARIYPPRFHEGITDSFPDRSAFTQRLRITMPDGYTINSTGTKTAEAVRGGRRTVTWESDYPLRVFNVAAGKDWAVRRGQRTAVFYYPGHPWNVPTLVEALDGALEHYGEWFGPYPWRELRLNELWGGLALARGNATNIFFSEGAMGGGFLSQRTPESDYAFVVAAHEAAHQWWGHRMAPGEGPGGIVLAEGAANLATLMLLERMRGFQQRMTFATFMETEYGEMRQPDTEKPLAETISITGRPGDEAVVYDRGGWALWMLMHQMGRERFLAGVRAFFAAYREDLGRRIDHPVIEDFAATLRPYAADPAAFDEFIRQWFYTTDTPEYRLEAEKKRPLGGGEWEVAVRVENAGTGRTPVEVAATAGERFDEKGAPDPAYHDARATVTLGAGEAREVRIRCNFEPQRLVVDPDGYVLQLQRRAAVAKL